MYILDRQSETQDIKDFISSTPNTSVLVICQFQTGFKYNPVSFTAWPKSQLTSTVVHADDDLSVICFQIWTCILHNT